MIAAADITLGHHHERIIEGNMNHTKNHVGFFLCLSLFGFACVDISDTLAVESGEQMMSKLVADSGPVLLADDLLGTAHDPLPFCEGPSCDGSTGQGPDLEPLLVSQVKLNGQFLSNVRVTAGELVADHPVMPLQTLHGAELEGAIISGPLGGGDPGGDLTTPAVQYRIVEVVRVADVAAVIASSDSWHALFSSGVDETTHLYYIERLGVGGWQPACSSAPGEPAFANWAIPMDAVWRADGSSRVRTSAFNFACMNGAIAKCYRWGGSALGGQKDARCPSGVHAHGPGRLLWRR